MVNPTEQIGPLAAAALDLLIEAVAQTRAADWDQPSNLADWSLRELAGHATGSAAKIVALIEGAPVKAGPSEPADWTGEEPEPQLRALAAQLAGALPISDPDAPRISPEGEVPLHRALAFPVADLALHSWDVHRSQGRSIELPAGLLAFCRGLVDSVPEPMLRRPGAFGPAQPVPSDSTPTAVLMAYLGRSVDEAAPTA